MLKVICHSLVPTIMVVVALTIFRSNSKSMTFWSAFVENVFGWSQQNFAHITTVTLPWHVQNSDVIRWAHFKPEHYKFWSNFEFYQNIVCGMSAWPVVSYMGKINSTSDMLILQWINRIQNYMCHWFPFQCSDRADSRFAPSQWEKSSQSNTVSHWLGADLESALSETWWRHDMEMITTLTWWCLDIETISTLLGFCEGNLQSPVDSPHKGPVTQAFCVFCDILRHTVEHTVQLQVICESMTIHRN